jgi:hypothetical protein
MSEDRETTAVQRLGYVCGWTGNGLGGLLLFAGAFLLATAFFEDQGNTDSLEFLGLMAFISGVLIILIGQALRYIFVGPKGRRKGY